MKMKPQWIYAICFLVFGFFISWRFYDVNYKKKNQEVFFQLQNQMTGVADSVALEIKNYLAEAIKLVPTQEDSKAHFLKEDSPIDFLINFYSVDGKTIVTRWTKQKETYNQTFNEKFTQLLTAQLTQNLVKENRIIVVSPNAEENHFILISPVQLQTVGKNEFSYLAAVIPQNVFKKIVDRQRGGYGDVTIVNDRGLSLGHFVNEYLGKSLVKEPIVEEIAKNNFAAKKGIYKNAKGQLIYATYEKIQGTNVYLLLSISQSRIGESGFSNLFQIVLLGLGFLIAGYVLISVFYQQTQETLVRLERKIKTMNATPSVAKKNENDPWVVPAKKAPVIMSEPVKIEVSQNLLGNEADERLKHYQQIAQSVSEMIRAPLTAILGNVQLAKSKTNQLDVSDYCSEIEKESRAAREMLTQLMAFSGVKNLEMKRQDMKNFLDGVFKNWESVFKEKNIKVTKDFKVEPELNLNTVEMEQALKNIIQNSIDSMDRSMIKELKITLESAESKIHLTISDSGEGIEAENLDKVFNPFFTTKSHFQHVGLGMSASLGIIKEHGGDIQVKSELGSGTTVKIILPIETVPKIDRVPKVISEFKANTEDFKNVNISAFAGATSTSTGASTSEEIDSHTMVISNVDWPPDDIVLKENRFFKRKIKVKRPGEKLDIGSH